MGSSACCDTMESTEDQHCLLENPQASQIHETSYIT